MLANASYLPAPRQKNNPTINLATLALDEAGHIQGCSKACEKLFGYQQGDLLYRHVTMLLPKLAGMPLTNDTEINPRLKFLCHCGIPFLARRHDGETFPCELFFNRLCAGKPCLQLIVRSLGSGN